MEARHPGDALFATANKQSEKCDNASSFLFDYVAGSTESRLVEIIGAFRFRFTGKSGRKTRRHSLFAESIEKLLLREEIRRSNKEIWSVEKVCRRMKDRPRREV